MRTGPPLDSQLLIALEQVSDVSNSLLPTTISELRSAMEKEFATDEDILGAAPVTLEHRVATGSRAESVPLIMVRPIGASKAINCIFAIHGGGLVAGGHRSGMTSLARLAVETNSTIISAEYRLAPEHPYPAAIDDCVQGLEWVAHNATELGVNADRIVVMGGSAGGGLAAALALRCRDSGGPGIHGLVLIQPMLDDRNESPSSHELENDLFWDRTSNTTAWRAYLGGTSEVPTYAAPAREERLDGLPPIYLEIGSADLFRDECLHFAAALSHARVPVELHLWPGGFHGFDGYDVELTREALSVRSSYFRRLLVAS